jgi:hypothetical protein
MKKSAILILMIFSLSFCGPGSGGRIEEGFGLQRIFAIDSEDSAISDLGIPDIFGFDASSDGHIYILRAYAGEGDFIFRFDPSGSFINSFGPQGEGPGEFQNPHHIALDSEDNVLIIDANGRFLKYDKEGDFKQSVRMPMGDERITRGPKGNLLVRGIQSGSENGNPAYSFSLKLVDPDLNVLKVVDQFHFSPAVKPGRFRATDPLYSWASSQDHIYIGRDSGEYRIDVFDSSGEFVRAITQEYDPVPISDEERERILKPFPGDLKNMMFVPDHHLPFKSFITDSEGRLLVATHEAGEAPGEVMVDLFNPQGEFIGRKSLNVWVWEGHMWALMSSGRFYCLREKDSGYKELVVSRLEW